MTPERNIRKNDTLDKAFRKFRYLRDSYNYELSVLRDQYERKLVESLKEIKEAMNYSIFV